MKKKIIALGALTSITVAPFFAFACSDDHEDEFTLEVKDGSLASKNIWNISLKKDTVSATDLIELLNSKMGSRPNYFHSFENQVIVKDKSGKDILDFTLGTYTQANGLATAIWLKQTLEEKFTNEFTKLSDEDKKIFTETSF